MKFRILLNSKHNSVISDFFKQTSQVFDCLSTSDCLDDIANHFKLFKPEAYVYFNEGAQCGPLVTQMRALKSSHDFGNVPIVVLGDETVCKMLERLPQKPDLILLQSTASDVMIAEIVKTIKAKQAAAPSQSRQASPASSGPRPISVISTPKVVQPVPVSKPEPAPAPTPAPAAAPVPEAAPKPAAQQIPPEKIIDEPNVKNSKANILVIDDDKNILRLIKSACSEFFNITTMLNADLIDKYFETKTVDLILLDYEMPGENGPQVFQRLRKIPNAATTPIVFLTGVSDRKKIQEVLSLKPQGYVLKPINMEKLFASIYSLIR
ncbi:MAG: response regulator [Oscillospiraceae bacterium]|nr:response regulator [Oscillospiraceae bacterium]